MKQYNHSAPGLAGAVCIDSGLGSPNYDSATVVSEATLDYAGSKVLVVQKYSSRGGYFVVVPGKIVGNRERNKTNVEPITDSIARRNLEARLRTMGAKGFVNFWGRD